MRKKYLLTIFTTLSWLWKLIPQFVRYYIFFFLLILESRGKSAEHGLRRLFKIEDLLSLIVNERAMKMGRGEHPKHELIPYHKFFIENLADCNTIVDLGCGYGAVSRSIAVAYPKSKVIGVDNDLTRYTQAVGADNNPSNLTFLLSDIETFKPKYKVQAVILSNVLEHIEDRVATLELVKSFNGIKKILIRVPNFERHWSIALRKKLGVNYFQDSDHKIEHSIMELQNELLESGLILKNFQSNWGEIWAVCLTSLAKP